MFECKKILTGTSVLALTAVLSFGMAKPAFAISDDLKAQLTSLLEDHEKVKAAKADLRVAKESVAVSKGDWYPTLAVSSTYGHERQLKGNETDDTQMVPRTFDLSVTQKVWDFGATDSAIRGAELTVRQNMATLDSERQLLLLDAVKAHLELISKAEVLRYARESEDNIKKQAELENAKVKHGSGFSTDVLQAKAQLAGAQARRVEAEGALLVARNRYKAVFGTVPADLDGLERLASPADLVPPSLDEAVKVALSENPILVTTRYQEQVAAENITKTKADSFAPVINAVAESNHSRDESGTVGDKHEDLIKLELSYSINLGMTALNTLKIAEDSTAAVGARLRDAQDQIEEQARNAWDQLMTARERAELKRTEADLRNAFLRDARKERALGRRSLIDVLSNETALINASSDATQAEMDVVLKAYELVGVMGRLEIGALR